MSTAPAAACVLVAVLVSAATGDYIIPAAFPGQWLNRMAAEAELDRPSSFSLQHLHSGVGVRKRTSEKFDEAMSYSLPEPQQQQPLTPSGWSTNLDELDDEPKIVMPKRTALFMDKLMVALHNAINGNSMPKAADMELVTRQKNAPGIQQQTGAAWTKSRKCYFNAVTCYGKRKRR